MMPAVEIADPDRLYETIVRATNPSGEIRRRATELGALLARQLRNFIREQLDHRNRVLGVVVLRGGALLYPGFVSAFDDADFCLIGMSRDTGPGSVRADYLTPIPQPEYDVVVYIDSVCATGNTLLETRRLVRKECTTRYEVAGVISSSARATRLLCEAGVAVVGLSLQESLEGNVVLPDLGRMDAGDLFSGVGFPGRAPECGR